jgi:hypothetical protein
MVDTSQVGRKLSHKRKERRLLSRAVQQITTMRGMLDDPSTPSTQNVPPISTPSIKPAPGYKAAVALFRQWEEEAARMTPEEIAADDAVSEGLLENVEKYPLSLRIPDLSGHD